MKALLLVFLSLIIFFLCYCADPDINVTPPSNIVLYREPDTLATQWYKTTKNEAVSDTINLAPYMDYYSKINISFNVAFDSNNTSPHEGNLIIDFSNKYGGCWLYTGARIQSIISAYYDYSIYGREFHCPNDKAVVRMLFQTTPDTIIFSNLKILGYKATAVI